MQLVNHDEAAQTLHLHHDDAGMPLHPLPQLGYVRWLRGDGGVEALLRADGVDPRRVHVVTVYSELPVVCVGREHLLAAWDLEADGPVPLAELDPEEELDPARFAPPTAPVRDPDASGDAPVRDPDASGRAAEAPNPLDAPAVPGAGERMALEIAASGVGHVVLPQSVARMFGRKDVVVLPLASELDETAGMSRADREAAATRAEVGSAGDGHVTDVTPNGSDISAPTGDDADDAAAGAARHPGWDVGLAWLKEADSDLVQAFVGVARGRRSGSSR